MSVPVKIRPMQEADTGFVFSSWMRSYRKGCREAKALDWNVYRFGQAELITKLLLGSEVLVAVNEKEDSQIFGYIVFTEFERVTAVHWVYVKEPFRRFGIARALFQVATAGSDHDLNGALYATHSSHNFPWLARKWRLTFNPYLVHEVRSETDRDYESLPDKAA